MEPSFLEELIHWYASHIVLGRALIFLGLVITSAILRRAFSLFLSKLLFRLLPKEYFKFKENLFKTSLHQPLKLIFQLFVIYIGFTIIIFPKGWQGGVTEKFWFSVFVIGVYKIVLIAAFTWLLIRVLDFLANVYLDKNLERQTKMRNQLIPFLRELSKILLIILSFFVMLGGVFHVNVGSIITGLGIGGLAVALAGKETIENLFASFTIFIDQPFVVGDFVSTGIVKGTVEKVGFRSTHIRTLEKTWVTIPNKKLVDDVLENITERTSFRIAYPIILDKENSIEDIIQFVKIANMIIAQHELVQLEPRVYFNEVGDGTYKVHVLYWLETEDDWLMNQAKQQVLTQILTYLKGHNISLADRVRI
jgi:MscS family membrane protein